MFMNLFLLFLFWLGFVFIRFFGKAFKLGSGTTAPGFLIETKQPKVLEWFNKKYKKVIFITGTNGKTTTRSILVKTLTDQGYKVCSNIGGANILRGIATALLADLKIFKVKVKSDYLVLEVEEATLPKLSKYIKPDILLITNIFRDQLDAYGEIQTTISYFQKCLDNCDCDLVFNLDDPNLLKLALLNQQKKLISFSLNIPQKDKPNFEAVEKKQNELNLSTFENIKNQITCFSLEKTDIYLSETDESNQATEWNILKQNKILYTLKPKLKGYYNLYNLLAVITLLSSLRLEKLIPTIRTESTAFGRGEKLKIGNYQTTLWLIKNPAGAKEVIKTLESDFLKTRQTENLFFLLNDNIADGKDVSWIWDIDFESHIGYLNTQNIYTSGGRGADMLLRLSYLKDFQTSDYITDFQKIQPILESRNTHILATYTAMLDIRSKLSKITKIQDIASSGN